MIGKCLNHVGGEWLPSEGGGFLEKVDPRNRGRVLCVLAASNAGDVAAAAGRVRAVLGEWSHLPPSQIEGPLAAFRSALAENRGALVQAIARDVGVSAREAEREVERTLRIALRWGERPPRPLDLRASRGPQVVALATPWDLPLIWALREIYRLLAAGHACLWHPSQHAPSLAGPLLACFEQSGFAMEPLAVLHGADDLLCTTLAQAPEVDRLVICDGLASGAPAAVEAPFVRRRRAASVALLRGADDLRAAARWIARRTLKRAGQIREAPRALAVHADIASALTDLIVEEFAQFPRGGEEARERACPLIDAAAVRVADAFTRLALEEGAAIAAGGQCRQGEPWRHGFHFEPTVLVNVTAEMRIWRGDVAGPFLSIASFGDEAQLERLLARGGFDRVLAPRARPRERRGELSEA
jgi:succinate-semialdehyde dehydrogenase/glutarate-semialdehyde dehydrogenase